MNKRILFLCLLGLHSASHAQSSQSLGDRLGQAFEKAAKATGAVKDYGPVRKVPKGAKPTLVLKDGSIFFNERPLILGGSFESWKKVIGNGSVCGSESEWPKWCKWDALGIEIGSGTQKNDAVKFLNVHINPEVKDEVDFPDVDKNGRPIERPWIVNGVFPGYFEFDNFGIDRQTKFWEIRASVDRKHDLRCGLRDCSQPLGLLKTGVGMYLLLNRNDEYGELITFSISALHRPN
jgi:hypothetical protein